MSTRNTIVGGKICVRVTIVSLFAFRRPGISRYPHPEGDVVICTSSFCSQFVQFVGLSIGFVVLSHVRERGALLSDKTV